MWASRYDPSQALAVAALSVEQGTPEQLRAELLDTARLFTRLDAECYSHPRGPVFATILQGDSQMPDAGLRKAFTDAARGLRSERHCIVLVTPSRVFRSFFKAITWLVPPKKGHEVITVDTLESAMAEAERFRGERLATLREMAADALRELAPHPPFE